MAERTQLVTRSQRFAQRAFDCVSKRNGKEYAGFAKRFPSLIHSCGLAQALAFAQAKAPEGYIMDLEKVLDRNGLPDSARTAGLTDYMRLSRDALAAAGWLKRYAEALLEEDKDEKGGA